MNILGFQIGGDGSSDQPQTAEYYKNFADGTTHLVRDQVSTVNGKTVFANHPQDMGAVASKAPPTDKLVVKTLQDGATWAYKFNPDGSVANSTQLSDAQGKPVDPSLSAQRDATTQLIDQKLADAEAMAPYNVDKARATIANLNARTDLVPAQRDLIDARVQRIASQNSVDPSRIGLNNAHTSHIDATTQALLEKQWASFEPQRQAIIAAHTAGNLTDDQFKQAIDNITQDAVSGLTAAQRFDENYRQGVLQKDQDTNAVNQGNNRATAAANYFDRAGSTAMEAAKGGAGGAAAAGGFLSMLHMAPQFQDSMGGAPVQLKGGSANPAGIPSDAIFGLQHAQRVAQLVTSGQAPPDANGDRFPAAVRMAGQEAGVMPGAGVQQPGWGPGNPDYDRQVAAGAAGGTGDSGSSSAPFLPEDLQATIPQHSVGV